MDCDKIFRKNQLRGFITELNFDEAEEAFPGIATFYKHCRRKPSTFLDLVWQFQKARLAHRDEMRARLHTA
jgi:hypothetical protein